MLYWYQTYANYANWAWGYNVAGELGDGTGVDRSLPVSVQNANRRYYPLDGGIYTSHFIDSATGAAWATGAGNTSGVIGNGTKSNYVSPVSVLGGRSYRGVGIGVSATHCLYLDGSDGSCYAVGTNTYGNLGNGSDVNDRSSPVSVVGWISYSMVSGGGNHSAGIRASDGSVWSWGYNGGGQLGVGDVAYYSSPVSMLGGLSYVAINAGVNHSLMLAPDGSCWAVGYNVWGQVGDNSGLSRSSPVSVLGGNSYVAISAGNHSLAIRGSDGSIWSWGYNAHGQCGVNSIADKYSPVSVVGDRSYRRIAAGQNHSLAISGTDVYAWGRNNLGQLGENSGNNRSSPVLVGEFPFKSSSSSSSSASSESSSSSSSSSASSESSSSSSSSSVSSSSSSYYSSASSSSSSSQQEISVSNYNSMFYHSYYGIKMCGQNEQGQLGDGSIVSRSLPVSVIHSTQKFYKINSGSSGPSVAIDKNTGAIWGWGWGAYGGIGNNSITSRSSPTSCLGDISYSLLGNSFVYHVGIRASDGSAWACGVNLQGQVGDNTDVNKSSPVSVVGDISYSNISKGCIYHTIGINGLDGSLWTWGYNVGGQLGVGDTDNRSTPTSVLGGGSYTKAAVGSDGLTTKYSSMVLKSDGSIWMYGQNTYGGLGNGTTTDASSPVSVLGDRSYVDISCGCSGALALMSDGGLWAWGRGTFGALGQATNNTSYSSPVSVKGDRSYSKIACVHHCVAISAGVIYAWGYNTFGQLGLGDTGNRSSPVSVAVWP